MMKLKIYMESISDKIEEIYRKTHQNSQFSWKIKVVEIKNIAKLIEKGSRNIL